MQRNYSISITLKTAHTFDAQSLEESIINNYFKMPFPTLDSRKIQIDTLALQKSTFEGGSNDLFFYFKIINSKSIQNDSLQFDIETILNTGNTLTARTSLLIFK